MLKIYMLLLSLKREQRIIKEEFNVTLIFLE